MVNSFFWLMIIERKSTEKKMQSSFELQAPVCRPCLPPTLKNTPGKGWRVEYYFINPFTQATERRAICLNTFRKKCRTQSDFRVMANRLIQVLTSKLALGWTPLGVVQAMAQTFLLCRRSMRHTTTRIAGRWDYLSSCLSYFRHIFTPIPLSLQTHRPCRSDEQ